jgi:hypothetical protein
VSSDYSIDSALDTITLGGNIPVVSYREAVQIIANASRAVVYIDKNNVIIVKQLTATASVDTIDFDNVQDIPKIVLDKRINTAEIAINKYTNKESSETVYDGVVAINGTQDVWIEYKSAPIDTATASSVVTGEISVNSETYYGNACLFNITASGNVTITITAKIKERATVTYIKADASKDVAEDTISIKLNNPLITDTATAESVADWVLAEKQERFINEIQWRQNPAHEVTDRVVVEDDFGLNKTSRIYKQDFYYDGALSGRTVTKGGE